MLILYLEYMVPTHSSRVANNLNLKQKTNRYVFLSTTKMQMNFSRNIHTH